MSAPACAAQYCFMSFSPPAGPFRGRGPWALPGEGACASAARKHWPGLTERSAAEEEIEERVGWPGQYIAVDDGDADNDDIPDYADGFDLDGIPGNDDDSAGSLYFAPLVLQLAPAYIEHGKVQIWAKDGDQSRNKANRLTSPEGDYVPQGTYTPALSR